MPKKPMKRPDMRAWFAARIDWHTNGMMARTNARLPVGVKSVDGDVTSPEVVAVMTDGTEHRWTAGQYSARKVNGCYPPLMPKPVK